MMQAPEPAKRSPWGLRLAVAGGLMVLIGTVMLVSQSETISTTMDPREKHHDQPYVGADTFPTGELTDTCYRFYQQADDIEMTVQLYRVEGSSVVGEALEESKCMLDWQALAADGETFVAQGSWVLNGTSKYALVTTCETSCEEATGWLVSVDAIQSDLLSSTWLMLGGAMCCLGILTTPIALTVYLASKPSRAPRVMMVGPEGQLIPITDVNPDHPTLFTQPPDEGANQPTVAPPFADTAEHQPSEEFVDGLNDVASGALLTTEQVYALMRGDVEGAQEHTKTARYQSTTAEDTIQDAANAAAITSWDEGVPLAEPQTVQSKPLTAKRSKDVPQSEKSNESWKDWDEQ
jgi:hypothetical protein